MRAEISYSSVGKILGELLFVEAGLLALPAAIEIIDGEKEWLGFVVAMLASGICGWWLWRINRRKTVTIRRREGFLLVSLVWVVFSAFGMIPFMMSKAPLSISDAYFETVSGFTTTGATTIADVEALSRGLLLWRSITQWIGGLGIVLFMLAVLPQLNEKGGVPMFNAETTGITHDKLHPRIRRTAASLWMVYLVLTLVLVVLLWAGPMDWYDAVNHALTAISTGGFSTKNDSIAFWGSTYINVVLTLFMFVGGINFGLLYAASRGDIKGLWRNDVCRAYFVVVVAAWVLTAVSLLIQGKAGDANTLVVEPMFHLVSDITTTGFSLADFSNWGSFPLMVTMLLMITGACAGSTSGAVKIDRLLAMRKNLINEIKRSIFPKRVMAVRVNGNVVSGTEMGRIMAFITIYALLALGGTLALTAYGWSFTDSFFATLSCVGNNGLGYGITGAGGGFHLLPDTIKWLMSLMMLAGRLELFSLLLLFFPGFWRK